MPFFVCLVAKQVGREARRVRTRPARPNRKDSGGIVVGPVMCVAAMATAS